MASSDIDRLSIDTIRTLSMDGVQAANSGHPGLPMAMAPVAYLLFARVMEHNPADPHWPDRDRFILSAGHGSMLLYSVLHLTGYDLPLDELKHFRQWGSLTPGITSLIIVGSALERTNSSPLSGSAATAPQFVPPLWPGISIDPRKLGGVNRP